MGKHKHKIVLPRPPIVAVLGHVDHGKTSLLDAIRSTKVRTTESGGITQHIGAYQVDIHGQKITFIDTPGHAAFAKMRARGALVTDLVILVVAATEGVKPQTKESISHIKAAGVPLIVAINKIDLPGASPDMVKAQLAESGIVAESYGGDVVCVETVATTGQGIPQLLDMIILVAGMNNLQSDSHAPLESVVIEANLHTHRGPLATLIVRNGSLKVGDQIKTLTSTGKVKALFNYQGRSLDLIGPGDPAEIMGFSTLPVVGESVVLVSQPLPSVSLVPPSPVASPNSPAQEEKEARPRIKAILKADTQGTLEAISSNIAEEVDKIDSGVGEVGEADVMLAASTQATILAFRVKVTKSAQKLAEIEGVTIKTYSVIYELLEGLEKQILKLLEPTIDEEVIGEADVVAIFQAQNQRIVGCKVKLGKLEIGGSVHLIRKGKIVKDTRINTIKQGPNSIKEVKKGEECGILLKPNLDTQAGDTLQYYRTIT